MESQEQETGRIRRFWDKITGKWVKHKKEVREPLAQPAEQKRSPEGQQLQDRIQELKERIQKAVAVDPEIEKILKDGEYPIGLDFGKEVERIEGSVTGRAIHGKFPPGVVMKGKDLGRTLDKDYGLYGDKQIVGGDLGGIPGSFTFPLEVFNSVLYETYAISSGGDNTLLKRNYNPDFVRKMQGETIISVLNPPDEKKAIFAYNFPQQYHDTHGGRPTHRVQAYFELPKVEAYKLLALIREDPVKSETFFKKAAEGVDGDENLKTPSLSREKSDGITILHLDKLNPDYFNPFASGKNLEYVNGPKIFADMEKNQGVIEQLPLNKQ